MRGPLQARGGNTYGVGDLLLPDRSPPPLPSGSAAFDQDLEYAGLSQPNGGGNAPTLTTRGTTRQGLQLLPIPVGGTIQWQLVAPYNPNRNYLILQNQTGGQVIQVSFKNPISLTQDLGILIPAGGNYELNVFVPVDNVYVATLSTAVATSNVTVLEG